MFCFFIADFHRDKWIYVHKGSTKEVSPHNLKVDVYVNTTDKWLTNSFVIYPASWILYVGRSI